MVSGRLLVTAAVFGASISAVGAQDASNAGNGTFVSATPFERRNPDYPSTALSRGQEGWVMVSYVVSETGTVEEAMIEDSSGVESFEQAALEAVQRWRYAPATQDGRPTEHAMVKTRIQFELEGKAEGARSSFVTKYRRTMELLREKDFGAAQPLIDELEFGERGNLYEDAWFWWLKYVYLDTTGSTDALAKQQSLQRALGYEEEYLAPDQFVDAAQRLYASYVQSFDLRAALTTFERLRDAKEARRSDSYDRVVERLMPSYEQIQEIVRGERAVKMQARVGEFDYWVHDLVRRSFTITNVSGRLDVLDVRCRVATRRYTPVPPNSDWTIPESWGECGVYIKGEPGTTFEFLEYSASAPAQVSQPAAAP